MVRLSESHKVFGGRRHVVTSSCQQRSRGVIFYLWGRDYDSINTCIVRFYEVFVFFVCFEVLLKLCTKTSHFD
jgi:hypothetical protein